MSGRKSPQLALAMAMLRRTVFAEDRAGAQTIWRQQRPEVRQLWLDRAAAVLADLDEGGYELADVEAVDPDYDADHG